MSTSKKQNTATTKTKGASKSEQVLALLRQPGGASIGEITGATNWQPHSARAVLTGFRKKGYGLDKAKFDGVTRYSIASEPAK